MVSALITDDWALLLQRIGEGPMIHLLASTSLFLDLGNDNLYQVAGIPIYSMKPHAPTGPQRQLQPDPKDTRRNPKRKRTESSENVGTPKQVNSPATIEIMRKRLFYGKPQRRPRAKGFGLHVGLPYSHILNDVLVKAPTVQSKRAEVVAKYIFPRQYGLHNVFMFEKEKGSWSFRDYSSRETELKKYDATLKTPRRVHHTMPLVVQLVDRHRRTNYHAILERACSLKSKEKTISADDSTTLLSLMPEAAYDVSTQIPPAATFDPSSEDHPSHNAWFMEFVCSHKEISSFAIAATSQVIPKDFWGSSHNYQQIKNQIANFVSCRRYESVTLHTISQNLRFLDFDWALANMKGDKTTHRSLSDIAKGRELVEEFLYWYFDSFLMPLLKTTFYCTESAVAKNQVLYFRHDDWRRMCRPLIDRLCSNTFDKLPKRNGTDEGQLGVSRVRLLPKENGIRPIINLRRKKGSGLSTNQILQATFQVLSYERDRNLALQGVAVTNHTEIFQKLKAFKQRHSAPDGTLPKLYFVKVDVQACFDSIEQGKLLEIIRRIIKEDEYIVQRYARLYPNAGKVKKQFCRNALPDSEDTSFLSLASELAASLRHTVFTDQVTYPRENRAALLRLLEEHVTSNLVKIGSDFYKQRIGIPQGSVLSTILCNVFYGDLEASEKFRFTDNVSNLLLRYVDDYLFITTNINAAKEFLEMMNKGHREYGCFISREKTITNFEQEPTVVSPYSREIIWCGLCIHLRNLNVTMDCSRFTQCNLSHSLTVAKCRSPGNSFKHKVLKMAKSRSHIIFTDATLNSAFTIYLNIYENFLFSAMKIVQYVVEWGVDVTKAQRFLEGVLRQAIMFSYISIKNWASKTAAKKISDECQLGKIDVLWLGFHAFDHILSRKKARFRPLYLSVRKELQKTIYIGHRRSGRFDSVIRTGIDRLRGIGSWDSAACNLS